MSKCYGCPHDYSDEGAVRYRIGRSWAPDTGKRAYLYRSDHLRNLTLEEAQAHCSDPSTRRPGVWFDYYTEDDGA